MPDTRWRWYVTVAAMRQYMTIAGYTGAAETDNPDFRRAEGELFNLAWAAECVPGKTTESGATIWRVSAPIRGRTTRLEFTVAPSGRDEGSLQQLVRVTAKARGGRKHK